MNKKTFKQQVVSRVMQTSALLIIAGGSVAPVVVNHLTQVHAASTNSNASSNPVADDTSARSITLWKYEAKDANDHGDAGDGTNQAVTNAPLAGVKFQIQRVLPVDGGAQLTDPSSQKEGTDYTIDTSFTAITQTTGSDGSTVFDLGTGKANDGIYLVTEVDDSGATDSSGNSVNVTSPTKPFFVYVPQTNRGDNSGLIYNVQVQPKNIVDNTKVDKTINGQQGDSGVAGNAFQYQITSSVPDGLYQIAKDDTTVLFYDPTTGQPIIGNSGNQASMVIKAGDPLYYAGGTIDGVNVPAQSTFGMTDELDDNLIYQNATVWVHNATGWVELQASDYTITKDGAAPVAGSTGGKLVMQLTSDGIKEVGSGSATDVNGATVTGPFDQIQMRLDVNTAPDFNGEIQNGGDSGHKSSVNYQVIGQKPQNPSTPEADRFNGGFDILKQDEATKEALDGAEFMIATSEDNANKQIFLASDGKSYGPTDTLPTGVTFLTTTSKDGKAAFDGLPLKWYTDTNNNGVQDADEPTYAAADIQQDYWVVETKAPTGYELLKTPQKVTVNLTTGQSDAIELTVNDKKSTDLPFTGGAGTAILITVALGTIGIGTALVVMDRKRKNGQNQA